MAATSLVLFRDSDGTIPITDWLNAQSSKVVAKCLVKIERLKQLGHELRRPEADYLRDSIYELRIGLRGQNYRLLYFFDGREVVVLSHGLTKEAAVPAREIELAIKRRQKYLKNRKLHSAFILQLEEPDENEDPEETPDQTQKDY
jgi:hypothetical protein